MILRKDQLEASLHEEKKLIETGKLKEDNPLDLSEPFARLCNAARRGDLKGCHEAITEGANINARDQFDYTPLILASLCGHYEVVQLLLESGALCERDTFQGERCLYNALNNRIRNLLLAYDYSKSADPLQPLAAHIASLLGRTDPRTSDVVVTTADRSFGLHKFILAARSPYFRNKLGHAPGTATFKVPASVPSRAFEIAIKHIYLGEIPRDVGNGSGGGFTEDEVLEGIDRISKHLEIGNLWQRILEGDDRRLARQQRTEEVERGRSQLETWFKENVLRHKVVVPSNKVHSIRWDRDSAVFADVLLRADEAPLDEPASLRDGESSARDQDEAGSNIPVGPLSARSRSSSPPNTTTSTLYPAHRAMLLRSEYFRTMFSSSFLEAQETPHLQIVPVDCSPEVLETVLAFLYTERADFGLDIAVDVLFAADLLLIERLKAKAAQIISTLGNGAMTTSHPAASPNTDPFLARDSSTTPQSEDPLDPFTTLRAAWLLRVPRLEEFAARYFAYRLERFVDLPEFAELVRESAARIRERQETDSIELVDDVRFYLSERFKLRFEGEGIVELMNGGEQEEGEGPDALAQSTENAEGAVLLSAPDGSGAVQRLARDVHDATHVLTTPAESSLPGAVPAEQVPPLTGQIRTLDGEIAGDEFAADALNYQLLLAKIDALLDRLQLDD